MELPEEVLAAHSLATFKMNLDASQYAFGPHHFLDCYCDLLISYFFIFHAQQRTIPFENAQVSGQRIKSKIGVQCI